MSCQKSRSTMVMSFTVAIMAVACLLAPPLRGKTTGNTAPRTPDGRPDLNGVWQAMNTANYDMLIGVYMSQRFPRDSGLIRDRFINVVYQAVAD